MVRHPYRPLVRVSTAEQTGMFLSIITCMPLQKKVILALLLTQRCDVMGPRPVS